ncbi:hypothetical protein EBO15_21885 [Actinomadura harenae]|uniref:Uncharacterized protein n=1 Tax=Actinomadura harenae TaxID=2483351 RepID=A0A3M2M096_9ACTN|nr:hypothetical protein EBO15_21885 [Actinomadura harenae]
MIDLAEPLLLATLCELRTMMRELSSHYEEMRPGLFDVSVPATRLGIRNWREGDDSEQEEHRPFLVSLIGPGIGDEDVFDAEHADEPEVEAVLGFRPTHAVNVIAGCNRCLDHVATALLAATVMDVIGGFVKAELRPGHGPDIADLPGMVGIIGGQWPTALGTAEFLRSWVREPGFRLVK